MFSLNVFMTVQRFENGETENIIDKVEVKRQETKT